MTEVIVHAGSCGFKTIVVVSKEARNFRIAVSSGCETVCNWGDHLRPLSLGEILNPQEALQFYESALCQLKHVACPVPLTVIKAIEVEAGAAPAKNVSIIFANERQKNFGGGKQGMVSEERKREILDAIRDAVVRFEEDECAAWCRTALEEGLDAYEATMEGLAAGMDRVGELYTRQEYFVPELLLCSDALYAGLDILRPHIKTGGALTKGRLLIGVVEGDIHDIGKNLVKTMFEAAGWEIFDLGKDVRLDRFVEEQKKTKADVVGLSALMTTSMMAIEKVIGMLKAADPEVKVLVGGAPLNPEIAAKFGADGYAEDAVSAVREAASLIKKY